MKRGESSNKVLVLGSMDALMLQATTYLDKADIQVLQSNEPNFSLRLLKNIPQLGIIIIYDISYFECIKFLNSLQEQFDKTISLHIYFTDTWFRIKPQLYQSFPKLNLHFISKQSNPKEVLARVLQSIRAHNQSLMNKAALMKAFPEEVIQQLSDSGNYEPKKIKDCSILFTDFVNFTETCQGLPATQILNSLNFYFKKFDEISESYQLQKIKTIGDSYMAISGMKGDKELHALRTVLAALEIQRFCQTQKIVRSATNKPWWDMRIGVNSGEIIGGVIGKDKLIFDVFGTNVNLASRLESSAKATEINISETTHLHINKYISSRLVILSQVKSFGKLNTYKVKNIKAKYAQKEDNLKPNATLKKIVRLPITDYDQIQRSVFSKLHDHLSTKLKYHNKQHTIDVINSVCELGRIEGVTQSDILLLRTAALFHDSGYVFTYEGHEDKSIEIAQNWLPKFHYETKQIDLISDLIEVTKLGVEPKTKLQSIMADADHSYFGNEELYLERSDALREEWNFYGKRYTDFEWFQEQYSYLQSHSYYTEAAKVINQLTKQKIIQQVNKILQDLAA